MTRQRTVTIGLVAALVAGGAGLAIARTDLLGERNGTGAGSGGDGASSGRPNVLVVVADDFGVDASPCYPDAGEAKPDMPTLESLCGQGVVFDQVWTNPVCTPSRAAMLTGTYGVRTGVGGVDDPLPDTEATIHRLLDEQTDYAASVIGKWHLGGSPDSVQPDNPEQLGVPYYAGVLSGQVEDYSRWPLTVDGETTETDTYITTELTDRARDWIAEQDRPWFTWLAYTAPHTPFHLPPDELHSRDDLTGERADIRERPREYYFAAAEAMDAELGRLLDSLPEGERENTVVAFVADNGSPRQVV
ncbi:MAG: sulfatase-like hydrolase/transferase, partial [Phycicoccus sp.]